MGSYYDRRRETAERSGTACETCDSTTGAASTELASTAGSHFDYIVSYPVRICDGICGRDSACTAGTVASVRNDDVGLARRTTSSTNAHPIGADCQSHRIHANATTHQATIHEAEPTSEN